MSGPKLVALYPHPTNVEQFERDYADHIKLMHEKLQLPYDVCHYQVTHFIETPLGKPMYYQMFTFFFNTVEEMQQGLSSPAMLALAEDAARISSGGPPVFLIGV